MSCFPTMLLGYFLNDFEMVPVAAPIVAGITLVSTPHIRCISTRRSLHFLIFSASCFIIFLPPEIPKYCNSHAPLSYHFHVRFIAQLGTQLFPFPLTRASRRYLQHQSGRSLYTPPLRAMPLPLLTPVSFSTSSGRCIYLSLSLFWPLTVVTLRYVTALNCHKLHTSSTRRRTLDAIFMRIRKIAQSDC
jgi:hypothetical protein